MIKSKSNYLINRSIPNNISLHSVIHSQDFQESDPSFSDDEFYTEEVQIQQNID